MDPETPDETVPENVRDYNAVVVEIDNLRDAQKKLMRCIYVYTEVPFTDDENNVFFNRLQKMADKLIELCKEAQKLGIEEAQKGATTNG